MQMRFRLVAGAFVSMLVGMSIGYLVWGRHLSAPIQETVAKVKKRHHTPDMVVTAPESSSEGAVVEAAGQSPIDGAFSICDEGLRLSKRACDAGQTPACETVLNSAPENSPEKKQALLSLLSQCEAAKPDACDAVTRHTENASPEYAQALQAGWRQCQANNIEACEEIDPESPHFLDALKRIQNICDTEQGSKQIRACKSIAGRLMMADSASRGRARSILKKKCEIKNVEACELFLYVTFGEREESEMARAITRDLCEANDAKACKVLSRDTSDDLDIEKMPNLKKRCDSNDFVACALLFRFTRYDREFENEIKAKIAKMCKANDVQACEWVLSIPREVSAENLKWALSVVSKKCEAGDMHACEVLGSKFTMMCQQLTKNSE